MDPTPTSSELSRADQASAELPSHIADAIDMERARDAMREIDAPPHAAEVSPYYAAEIDAGPVRVAAAGPDPTRIVAVAVGVGGAAVSTGAALAYLDARSAAGRNRAALVGLLGAIATVGGAALSALGR